jgi:hypothetical protein
MPACSRVLYFEDRGKICFHDPLVLFDASNRSRCARSCWPSLGTSRRLISLRLGHVEALTAKNHLTAADAKLVEDAFERRFSGLPSSVAAVPSKDDSSVPLQVIATTEALTLVKRRALTRASWRSLRRGAIATGSTCAMSPNRRVSCAAASPRTPTASGSPSPVRSAARSAMSSRSHSAAGIIVRCIAHATSARPH